MRALFLLIATLLCCTKATVNHAQLLSQGTLELFSDASGLESSVDSIIRLSQWGINTSQAWDAALPLSNSDASCVLANQMTVPSSCAEPNSECHTCFESATRALNSNRRNLHRAFCITNSNLVMAKSAIAFGDSASGIHGASGLAWSLGGKPQIEQATNQLKATYRRKYGDFIRSIETNMRALARCEAKHFNERDWYDRFGFMYVEHLRLRYENPDR